ncbi:3-hydroxybenzoate 6-hydroxylase 2 [Diaporthe amygdali]|uniref:3-hydroxybenzoate 6-hydroxylase 2 n=1 Tax=Phomopsis amygdali TaxID=1214568 RepID=UPI0022FDC56A|nr:3-hydroxybenzoate 6-hydroxylase 2 [Diaporthe amygdali]KAJ0122115.1 3-hydroxybenzoate 6-hydroxylase 2 [Diaporthe amygdali]
MGYYTRRPTKPDLPFGSLSFVIVGAGIAGLTAALAVKKQGHHVVVGYQYPSPVTAWASSSAEETLQVLEKSKFATEQGAALALSPNCSILLNWLDLRPESFGSDLIHHFYTLRAWYPRLTSMKEGSPWRMAADFTVTFCLERMGFTYVLYYMLQTLADHEQSMTRKQVCLEAKPKSSGFSAFRWLTPIEKVAAALGDKGPVDVLQSPGAMLQWDDTSRRLLAYPCANNTIYNMLAYVPSSAVGVIEEGSWNSNGNKGNLVQAFSKFSPEVQQLVGEADDSLRVFALSDIDPLPTWVNGRTALLGDAAHILQPYVGQGASMAIEDALSIATMFPLGTRPDDVNARLRLYENARMSRTNMVRDWALKNSPGSVPLASEGSWWFSSAVTKLTTWRVLAQTAMFMQQTFGHNEIDHSNKILQQALARRPSLDVDIGRRKSSIWSFVLGEGQTVKT